MQDIDPRFLVKICGITNLDDARMALEAGANALGFNFYTRSPRYASPERVRRIADALPGGYLKVGVFVNAAATDLLKVVIEANLDVVQLHGACGIPDATALRIWRSVSGEGPVPAHNGRVEAYLLDAQTELYGGSGQTFAWERAKLFPHRTIVAGGLEAANVAEAISALQPWGVDACSRLEESPGKKDPDKTRAFVAAALAARMAQV